jgi:hypothetical protein
MHDTNRESMMDKNKYELFQTFQKNNLIVKQVGKSAISELESERKSKKSVVLEEMDFLTNLINRIDTATLYRNSETEDSFGYSCDDHKLVEYANELTSILKTRLDLVQKFHQGKRSSDAQEVMQIDKIVIERRNFNKAQVALKILSDDYEAAEKMCNMAFGRNCWSKYEPPSRGPRCTFVFPTAMDSESETTLGYVSENSDSDNEDDGSSCAPYEGTICSRDNSPRPQDVSFGAGHGVHDFLERQGYYMWPGVTVQMVNLSQYVQNLVDDGWPASFVFLFDQTWDIVFDLWDHAAPLLGQECLLEPTFLASFSSPGTPKSVACKLSSNLHEPTRNYSYQESTFSDGYERLLQAWVPLTDGTLDGGCLAVVPKEFDSKFCFDGPNLPVEYRPELGCNTLNFDLAGIRSIPAPAGSVFLLRGNLIHWTTRPKSSELPQASLTCSFRHMQSAESVAGPGLSREQMRSATRPQRLQLICRSLLLQNPNIEEDSLPTPFWDKLPDKIKRQLRDYK